ncbi:MAG TPA: phosphatase PAP2 family protein [Kofleriaceae bacterium]|jgi:membrane-associated phospholipid phosphatase
MICRLAVALAVTAAARPARADGPSDRTREVEAAVTTAMGAAYLVAEVGFSRQLSPTTCTWCDPDGFDAGARNLLRWRDTSLANTLSDATGYVSAPLAAAGLTILAGRGHDWRRHYDDVVPIVQAAIAASLVQHVTKVTVARQRPYAHYAAPGTLVPSEEDNVSFWSGHTSLTFALAVSAGTVTSSRGYALAPVVWATGLGLAAATGYLRIAADRHYATDALTGAVMGTLVGYAWPKLVHPWIGRDVDVVPTANGLAAVGRF